jgi:hypothetical protein
MLERLRNQIGTAGLIVAIVALVAALGGGAYAATGGSSDGKATASAKAKQGKPGKPGKTGPAGPAGPAGAAGPAGPKGDTGAPGANGSNGANGVGVTGVPVVAGQEGCPAGGVKYTSASGANTICNGKAGPTGPSGFGETLPAEKTATGVWSFGETLEMPSLIVYQPISFPIKLPEALDEDHVHVIKQNGEELSFPTNNANPTECEGTATDPTATPGNLCVYISADSERENIGLGPSGGINPIKDPTTENEPGAAETGALLVFSAIKESAYVGGTWAVTAPEE